MSIDADFPSERDTSVDYDRTRASVQGPALALIIVSVISLVVLSLCLIFDIYLLNRRAAGRVPQPPFGMSEESTILFRSVWTAAILLSNVVILIGAIKMRCLNNYVFAKMAVLLSIIPCLGPCCVFGMPFGIWALVVLNKPSIKDAFD